MVLHTLHTARAFAEVFLEMPKENDPTRKARLSVRSGFREDVSGDCCDIPSAKVSASSTTRPPANKGDFVGDDSAPQSAPIQTIAVYGKGGVGKSVVATNLSVYYARSGYRVLHVGCDPKHDSAVRLLDSPQKLRTVLDLLSDNPHLPPPEDLFTIGRYGIACCESGGPLPGLGCGGRGVARVIETLDELQVLQSGKFDVAVFDVLGDVVCGGFAAPLREGFARKLIIVLSEEPMALFAANNIARAVDIYHDNGVRLAGLVINLRSNNADLRPLEAFARRLGTTILGVIERDPRITEAERSHLTLLEYAPSAPSARVIEALANKLLAMDSDKLPVPSPMTDEEFFDFLRANGE